MDTFYPEVDFAYHLYIACYFNSSSSLRWNEKQHEKTKDVIFDHAQFFYLKTALRETFGPEVDLQSCVEGFPTIEIVKRLTSLRPFSEDLKIVENPRQAEVILLKKAGDYNSIKGGSKIDEFL